MKNQLFVQDKLDYCRGLRPQVDCILCSVLQKDPKVKSLLVWENPTVAICLNLYPYNPGHLMVFPKRHLESYGDLKDREALAVHRAAQLGIRVLEGVYGAPGFNLGWNLGEHSGASIRHLHLHVVPRYKREVGFMDLLGQARVIVEHPQRTLEKMQKEFRGASVKGK